MRKNFNNEETANADMQFFIIPNGSDEFDNISLFEKKIPDKDINEETIIKKDNPFKDIEVNDTEFNINTIRQKLNVENQSEENDKKILSHNELILNTFSSGEDGQDLYTKCLKKYYFKKYNLKFKRFITEYANNLFRKHLLYGKIQKPRISLFKFNTNIKIKNKNKVSSFTMKKMFCFHKRKNKKIIKRILSFIKKFDYNKKYEYVKSFLSLKIEDAIEKFEESERFKKLFSDKKIILLDKEIKLGKGFSILEKNAYAKMVKIQSVV